MTYVWPDVGLLMVGGAGVGITLAGNSAIPKEKLYAPTLPRGVLLKFGVAMPLREKEVEELGARGVAVGEDPEGIGLGTLGRIITEGRATSLVVMM